MSQLDNEALKKAESLFSEVIYEGTQREEVIQVATLLAQFIPISEIALRGFITMAITDYQEDNKVKIGSFHDSTPAERVTIVTDLFARIKVKLQKILKRPDDEATIDASIEKALQYWIKNYA